jgi:site-specific recombinase XerC
MKREVRSKSVGTKVTEAELRVLESRAERAGLTLSEWVRDVLLGSCHLFRHTMATLMHEGGADIRFIQQMLGHEDIKTTQIYTQVAIRTLQQVHAATHPAALLEHSEEPSPKPADPDAEALFQALAHEAEDDRE